MRTYGNEERYFLRKLQGSYGILTDERNSYVLLQRTTAIRERRNGNVTVETAHLSVVSVRGVHPMGEGNEPRCFKEIQGGLNPGSTNKCTKFGQLSGNSLKLLPP